MALTPATARAALDAVLVAGTTYYVEWSESATTGTTTGTVSSKVAATAVQVKAADDQTTFQRKAINVASPPLLSAAASSAGTITHWRFTTAASGGTAKTTWNALTTAVVLASGGQISLADAALFEKLTPA